MNFLVFILGTVFFTYLFGYAGRAPSQRKERKLEQATAKRSAERKRIDEALSYELLSIDEHVELMRAKLFPSGNLVKG